MGNRRAGAEDFEGIMATYSSRVESLGPHELTPALIRAGTMLAHMTWPAKESIDDRVARYLEQATLRADEASATMWHFVCEGGVIVAIARSFRREVATEAGTHFPVLALAGVCTHPAHRGRGLGGAVVMAAWSRLNTEIPVSFFQTGVPRFYEGMKARQIENRIFNSTGDKRAFWDTHAMIYPGTAQWPTEALDLLGPGW